MDLRVLRYFLTVAKEQSFTKAAKQLHITQPTLSRQLAALEAELGVTLFDRGGHGITLTNEGILLKRRALEMVDLEDKIASEFKGSDGIVEGTITVGCGEFMAVEIFARICKIYKEKYPMVRFAVHTGTADTVFEMMNRGLVDIGLFLVSHVNEPDYFRRQSGIFSSQHAACAICPGTGIYHGIDDPGTPSVLRNCHAGQV